MRFGEICLVRHKKPFKGHIGSFPGIRILKQPLKKMVPMKQRLELKSELPGIGIGLEMPFLYCDPGGARQGLQQFAHHIGDLVPYGSRPVVELGGTGYHDTTAGQGTTIDPVLPVLENSLYSGDTPWFIERGTHDLLGKHLRHPLDHLCLEVFF